MSDRPFPPVRPPRLAAGAAAVLLAALAPAGAADAPVAVHIAGIRMVGPEQVMLLLADASEERALPIAIGREQGIAIYLGREKAPTPRPMTHDLLVTLLKTVGASIERITVTALKQDTYYAEIAVRAGDRLHAVDARPSDAIALAVRLDTPIFAAPDLLRPIDAPGLPGNPTTASRRLGMTVQELDPDLAEFLGAAEVRGLLVASVAAGGPAGRAGVRRGDILAAIDGRPLRDLEAWRAARESIDGKRFTVWREGRTVTLTPR